MSIQLQLKEYLYKEPKLHLRVEQLKMSKEFKAGYDAGLNGPNTTNCDFRIFSTPEKTKEWERGNKAGMAEKSRQIKNEVAALKNQ